MIAVGERGTLCCDDRWFCPRSSDLIPFRASRANIDKRGAEPALRFNCLDWNVVAVCVACHVRWVYCTRIPMAALAAMLILHRGSECACNSHEQDFLGCEESISAEFPWSRVSVVCSVTWAIVCPCV